MFGRISTRGTVVVWVWLALGVAFCDAATLGPTLAKKLAGAADSLNIGPVVVAFRTGTGLSNSHIAVLTGIGVVKGVTFPKLGMVAIPATAGQVRKLAANAAVRSVWLNDRLSYFNDQTRVLTGTNRMRTDPDFRIGGLPVNGSGDFSVVINDSGVDGTHADLRFPNHVIQNVQLITDSDLFVGTGFGPLTYLENVPDTDTNSGHGTHCAGIVGGTGVAFGGGRYAGVAPGAKLIGIGSGAAVAVLNALGGFEWTIANQAQYKIRVMSNSWGNSGSYSVDDPINIASKKAHDLNIVVVFAAGNSGPGKNTLNGYAKAPWVIGVAAGTKEGGLASFSSRGVPGVGPTITAPGTGREFESNADKFTLAVVSTRSKTNFAANGLDADAELPPAAIPFYTQISGTSMATPFVAGTAALMLSVDPKLSAAQVKQFLVQTASQMPGYSSWEIGAGYINVYAAVDKVFRRGKGYGTYGKPLDKMAFNLKWTVTGPGKQAFHINYNPAAAPGPGSTNSRTFTVQPNMDVLDVMATFDTAAMTGDGNTIGILLTDPKGNTYSSGIALPILDSPSREVVVQNPVAGQWLLEARGVRGLAALPNFSLPTSGAAAPGPVDGTITQQRFVLPNIPDIQTIAAKAEIEFALRNRLMDVFPDKTFRPNAVVTRSDFAGTLVLNTALRQSLETPRRFSDVSGTNAAIAEAVTADGSTLRDYDFTPAGMLSATGMQFLPNSATRRIDVAVALVRALGMDDAAKSKAGTNITVAYNNQSLVLADNSSIPPALRGYVQLALDRQILQATISVEQGVTRARAKPNDPVIRSALASAFANYRNAFTRGN